MRIDLDDAERAALLEVASTCLCQKARNASRAVTRLYDQRFAGSGVEPTQFTLLTAIRLFGQVSVAQLANHLGLERTTLTRNLEILRRGGMVEIKIGDDARRRLLSLTVTGRRALLRALPHWRQAQKAAISRLGKVNFARLSQALSLSDKITKREGNTHEEWQIQSPRY